MSYSLFSSDLIQYIVDPMTARPFNEHWQPMTDLCDPCLHHFDVIAKYETAQEDIQFVLQVSPLARSPGTGVWILPLGTKDPRISIEFMHLTFQHTKEGVWPLWSFSTSFQILGKLTKNLDLKRSHSGFFLSEFLPEFKKDFQVTSYTMGWEKAHMPSFHTDEFCKRNGTQIILR